MRVGAGLRAEWQGDKQKCDEQGAAAALCAVSVHCCYGFL